MQKDAISESATLSEMLSPGLKTAFSVTLSGISTFQFRILVQSNFGYLYSALNSVGLRS